jgi:hypothetical protein
MRVARGEDKGFVTIKMPADGIMAAQKIGTSARPAWQLSGKSTPLYLALGRGGMAGLRYPDIVLDLSKVKHVAPAS